MFSFVFDLRPNGELELNYTSHFIKFSCMAFYQVNAVYSFSMCVCFSVLVQEQSIGKHIPQKAK